MHQIYELKGIRSGSGMLSSTECIEPAPLRVKPSQGGRIKISDFDAGEGLPDKKLRVERTKKKGAQC